MSRASVVLARIAWGCVARRLLCRLKPTLTVSGRAAIRRCARNGTLDDASSTGFRAGSTSANTPDKGHAYTGVARTGLGRRSSKTVAQSNRSSHAVKACQSPDLDTHNPIYAGTRLIALAPSSNAVIVRWTGICVAILLVIVVGKVWAI